VEHRAEVGGRVDGTEVSDVSHETPDRFGEKTIETPRKLGSIEHSPWMST
jgi:hypothetical protein